MSRLGMFNLITLDGFYKGRNDDISWHNFGKDEQNMSDDLSNRGNTLIFGRVTYDMMFGYWSSAEALKNDPMTAQGMNQARKIVFSKTLKTAEWQNTTLVQGDLISEIRRMKKEENVGMTILGSGQIVAQLAEANLIDDYVFLLNPLALGEGRSLFSGLSHQLKLNLNSAKTMKSGNVLLSYSAQK